MNYKTDAEHLSRDLQRLCFADQPDLSAMEIHKHYTGMDQTSLKATEKILTSTEREICPIVVVATLGLGVGLDLKRVAFVAHYTFPTSVSRISQEWGRAGRGPKIPVVCLTFNSKEELSSVQKVVLTQSPVAERNQAMLKAGDLVLKGLSLLRCIVEGRITGSDHIRLQSHESTALGSWAALWLKKPALSCLSFLEKWGAVRSLSAITMTFCAELPWLSFHFAKVTARIVACNEELKKSFRQVRISFEEHFGETFRRQHILHITRQAEQYLKALFDEELGKKSNKFIYLRPDVIALARRIRPVRPGRWIDPVSCQAAEKYLDSWFRATHVRFTKDEGKSRNRFGLEGTICVPRFPAWIKDTDCLLPAAVWKTLPKQIENALREHLDLLLTDLQELEEFLFFPAQLCTQQRLARAHDLESEVAENRMDDFICFCSSRKYGLSIQDCIAKVLTTAV